MAVEQSCAGDRKVPRSAPDRLAEFDELIADVLNNPVSVQEADQ